MKLQQYQRQLRGEYNRTFGEHKYREKALGQSLKQSDDNNNKMVNIILSYCKIKFWMKSMMPFFFFLIYVLNWTDHSAAPCITP